ncbi:MAG: site-specific integrase [Sphingomonadales bacterium]|nr:site-specific integrase [Sphingomonadales bacterium]MDE2570213.1 site-specific integrase [Sphingomonadales bacterium]
MKGFGLRVSPTGEKAWFVVYRAGDGGRDAPRRRVTIGKVGTITPEQAREAAQKLLSSVRLGADPATAKAARRASATVSQLAEAFLTRHVRVKRKPGTAAHYADILNRLVLPELGSEKADMLTRADIARLHLKLADTPFQANRMLAIVGSMYSFGADVGLVPEDFNPARRVERYEETSRERFLTTGELERIGAAIREAETVGVPWRIDGAKPPSKHLPKNFENRRTTIAPEAAAALRLLIFTGARLREILHLRWQDVDMERGLLLLPDSKTGRKTVVLNAPALAVLAGLEHVSAYVIPGEPGVDKDGKPVDRPRADLKRPWAVVSQQAGLEGVRLHDLRHTFASYGAMGGLGLSIIGKLLGHMQASTTHRYAHVGADPLRKASDAIANTIAAAMGEFAKDHEANVTSIQKTGK